MAGQEAVWGIKADLGTVPKCLILLKIVLSDTPLDTRSETAKLNRMKKDWWDKEFHTLVTLGESTTAGGWADCAERSWPSQLARTINEFQRVPVQLVNAGIGGNVLSPKSAGYDLGKPSAMDRVDKHVFTYRPDLLIISYGLNDACHGTPLDLFCNELAVLIGMVRQTIEPLIVLPGPYYMYAFDYPGCEANLEVFHQFNEGISQIAEQTGCLYVDLMEAYGSADWLVHQDGMHANSLGHRVVANKIFEVLAANCSGLSLETRELEPFISRWRDERALQRDYGIYFDDTPTPTGSTVLDRNLARPVGKTTLPADHGKPLPSDRGKPT